MPIQLAPWIQIVPTMTGSDVLGPGLARYALSVQLEAGQVLPDDGAQALLELGLAWTPPADIALPPTATPPTAGLVLAPGARPAGRLLAAALAEMTGEPWRSAERPDARWRPRQTVFIGAWEPETLAALVTPLLSHGPVLWSGEALEGPHLGPLLREPADVTAYLQATRGWAHIARLEAAGFHALPGSIARAVVAAPARLAALVGELLRSCADRCWLVDEDRPVRLWTAREPTAPDALEEQRWSKGFLLGLDVAEDPEIPRQYRGTCRAPHARDDELEGIGGKGSTPDEARRTTIGEAVERVSAWMANQSLAALDEPLDYPLASFQPWGPRYDRWQAAGSSALPGVAARDELSGARAVVPICLVPFSYVPGDAARIATAGDTAGLAAFPTREGAVLRAALELLERHDLYPALRHLRPGQRLAIDSLPEATQLHTTLLARGLRPWLLRFDAPVPVVHAFVLDPATGAMSRGTGSGATEGEAARKALGEALQLRALYALLREESGPMDPGYAAFARQNVVERLCAWIEAMPEVHAASGPAWRDDHEALDHVKAALRRANLPLLVVDLRCPVSGWSAVRALVPGLCTHAHPSRSAGGERLSNATFAEPVPI